MADEKKKLQLYKSFTAAFDGLHVAMVWKDTKFSMYLDSDCTQIQTPALVPQYTVYTVYTVYWGSLDAHWLQLHPFKHTHSHTPRCCLNQFYSGPWEYKETTSPNKSFASRITSELCWDEESLGTSRRVTYPDINRTLFFPHLLPPAGCSSAGPCSPVWLHVKARWCFVAPVISVCVCTIWMWANTHFIEKALHCFPAVRPAVFGLRPHTRTHAQSTAGAFMIANQQHLVSWEEECVRSFLHYIQWREHALDTLPILPNCDRI